MLLSIIIPVYNLEDYIGRCLDSCLSQKLSGGYEIICVNDGSKDSSLAILCEYERKYPNVRVIDKPNGGVSSARNAGISEAKGDYIWFIDGDDWIVDGCAELIENVLAEKNITPDTVLFGSKTSDIYIQANVSKNTYEIECMGAYGTLKNSYSNSVWGRWMRLDLIKKNGISFNTKMKYGEDTLFVSQYTAICSSTIAINAPFYYYFQRAQSAMNHLDAQAHLYCMLNLVLSYKKTAEITKENDVRNRMDNAVIRGMQAVCRDLCIYCNDRNFVRSFMILLQKNGLYPFGVDWKQFKRDKKQSLKNDLMNWLFGFLSWKPYFWLCWTFCGLVFNSKRTSKFSMQEFDDILAVNGEKNE